MHFTVEAQSIVRNHVTDGTICIDGTAGNGWDTQFLAELVGPTGRVYAFDIQTSAIDATRTRLVAAGLEARVQLLHSSHDSILQHIDSAHVGSVAAAMFNLGYLPLGDKSITTQTESTLRALDACWNVLRPGGILVVLAYKGHASGTDEAIAVAHWMRSQSSQRCDELVDTNNAKSPSLWIAIKPNAAE